MSPEPTRRPRLRAAKPKTPLDLAWLCAAAGLAKKALDPLLLEVGELTGYADYFLLLSGRSTRQATAIAENIAHVLKKAGAKLIGEDGVKDGRWGLLDYGDVVVHVFHEPVREFYDLESLWADAPRLSLDEDKLASLLPVPAEPAAQA